MGRRGRADDAGATERMQRTGKIDAPTTWREGDTVGYSSRGLGVSGRPLRFDCPGEMAVITLRRGQRRKLGESHP